MTPCLRGWHSRASWYADAAPYCYCYCRRRRHTVNRLHLGPLAAADSPPCSGITLHLPAASLPPPPKQMHSNGYPEEEKPKVLSTFFKVVCPLAERLDEAGERLVVHWADSMEVLRLIPEDGSTLRMAMPADACQSKDNSRNIDYWARIGFLSYGTDRKLNADLQVNKLGGWGGKWTGRGGAGQVRQAGRIAGAFNLLSLPTPGAPATKPCALAGPSLPAQHAHPTCLTPTLHTHRPTTPPPAPLPCSTARSL